MRDSTPPHSTLPAQAAGIVIAALGVVLMALVVSAAQAAETLADHTGLLRLDPILGKLVPVPESEAKPNNVYSYFNARLNRRVWGIRLADGGMAHALGEGTTQPALAFDMRESREEGRKKLAEIDNELKFRLERSGGITFLTIDSRNNWQLDGTASHATIYDVETGFRWDWSYERYLPVSGRCGYRWTVVGGQYVSVP